MSKDRTMDLIFLVSSKMNSIRNLSPITTITSLPSISEISLSKQVDKIDIIIGSDLYYKIASGNFKRISDSLNLLETRFGYAAHGSINSSNHNENVIVFFSSISNPPLEIGLKFLWDNELAGITPTQDNPLCDEAIKQFHENIDFKENRYCVRLPWIEKAQMTSTYESQARVRLRNTTQRLLKLNKLLDYNAIFKEYLDNGIIEVCAENISGGRFIPHYLVIKEEAQSTKLRIVFDASAHEKDGQSVNSCLHDGPNLFPNILGI